MICLTVAKHCENYSSLLKRKEQECELPIIFGFSIFTGDGKMTFLLYVALHQNKTTVKTVYKEYSREHENVPFMSSYMQYSLMRKMRLPFKDSGLLYGGAL